MAYTSVIPVHRLDNSIDYVTDKSKTVKDTASLEAVIEYALNREKTEQTAFEDSIGCICETAYADMAATKKRFHKTDGVQGYHLIQSFAKGEVTPELAHLIGQEFAHQLLKGEFEVVITTHLNTNHYHNHFVWNSVSMIDGHKYHSNGKSYYTEIRRISDDLCRKYGLSVIQGNQGKAMQYAQWKAEKEGKPTWRTAIRMDIRESIQQSFTWTQFIAEMEKRGYTWKLNRKYIALKTPEMERYIRLRSLGKGYSEEEIRNEILKPGIRRIEKHDKIHSPKKKLTGLQALYYSYLYQMGVLKKKPRRVPYSVRSDIRRLDLRIRQMEFLQAEHITTREQLTEYRKPLEEKVTILLKERRALYRDQPGSERLNEITEELKILRKKIRLTVQIEQHSIEMEERMKRVEIQVTESQKEEKEKVRREVDR